MDLAGSPYSNTIKDTCPICGDTSIINISWNGWGWNFCGLDTCAHLKCIEAVEMYMFPSGARMIGETTFQLVFGQEASHE